VNSDCDQATSIPTCINNVCSNCTADTDCNVTANKAKCKKKLLTINKIWIGQKINVDSSTGMCVQCLANNHCSQTGTAPYCTFLIFYLQNQFRQHLRMFYLH